MSSRVAVVIQIRIPIALRYGILKANNDESFSRLKKKKIDVGKQCLYKMAGFLGEDPLVNLLNSGSYLFLSVLMVPLLTNLL